MDAAFCGQCGSKTPILVEVNAGAQYVSQCETFVEFRVTNVSFEEVTLSAFAVMLNDVATIQSQIY